MGIHKKGTTFYIKCDNDCCKNIVELKATTFSEASKEAKKLGWLLCRDKTDTGWVNFCTEFCKTCYNAPTVIVYYTSKNKTTLGGMSENSSQCEKAKASTNTEPPLNV